MPSFWKLLCFPKQSYRTDGKRRSNVPKTQRRSRSSEILDNGRHDTPCQVCYHDNTHEHVSNDYHSDMGHHVHRGDSGQRLIDDHRQNKRRRVQDIFNIEADNDENDYIISNGRYNAHSDKNGNTGVYGSNNLYSKQRGRKDFGSGYTPNLHLSNSREHVESMYAYVPKAVQNVYASKALEGVRIDDFFNKLHRESSLTQFSLKPANFVRGENKTQTTQELSPFTDNGHDKVSLLQQDERSNVNDITDMAEEYNKINSSNVISPRHHDLNTNFDQIWNCSGEVLY